jgi:hypothetical protein
VFLLSERGAVAEDRTNAVPFYRARIPIDKRRIFDTADQNRRSEQRDSHVHSSPHNTVRQLLLS